MDKARAVCEKHLSQMLAESSCEQTEIKLHNLLSTCPTDSSILCGLLLISFLYSQPLITAFGSSLKWWEVENNTKKASHNFNVLKIKVICQSANFKFTACTTNHNIFFMVVINIWQLLRVWHGFSQCGNIHARCHTSSFSKKCKNFFLMLTLLHLTWQLFLLPCILP